MYVGRMTVYREPYAAHDILAGSLESAVGFVRDFLDAGILECRERIVLINSGFREIRIGRDAGNKDVVPDAILQGIRSELDVSRDVAAVVDDDVPITPAQRFDLAITVAEEGLQLRKLLRTLLVVVEERDLIATAERCDGVRTDETGATLVWRARSGFAAANARCPKIGAVVAAASVCRTPRRFSSGITG